MQTKQYSSVKHWNNQKQTVANNTQNSQTQTKISDLELIQKSRYLIDVAQVEAGL